ncbi:sugar phosphate isomerase/epimerase family protein [Blautia pseudococcoides]|uniref:Xylose isomerase-like TIM barrel domain-containing protein n=1 Tax=Blautia pseudococcoides TaxID=1796616 RepID=A0A1C7IJC2_9FIRM|nr:sugar phosphate isomerase/epimerase family protein [Blautia pseudococcoides]ANU78222.1 hypothetical protein A4V09_22230 [Blautia pseudococcoides]ASU31034.1 sugar phosphate isomerase/epimerase [Blautia pseudococcoides]QQQ91564.1 sugar phosphate isomerase/epimerase [Blautia pseudococcoides]
MKKSITIWALKGGISGNISVINALKEVKMAGFDGLEVSLWENGDIAYNSKLSDLHQLKKSIDNIGGEISSMSTLLLNNISLISQEKSERNKAYHICQKMLDIAHELNIPSISISPGKITNIFSYKDCILRAEEQIKGLAEYAEKKQVLLCVENVWQGLLLSPIEFANFCNSIDSGWVSSCIDIGNAAFFTPPDLWINELNRIGKVHITDIRKRRNNTLIEFVNPLEGQVNWKEVMQSIRKLKYNGYLTIETFAKHGQSQFESLKVLNMSLEKIILMGKTNEKKIDNISTSR